MIIEARIETLPLYDRMDKGARRLVFGVQNAINSSMLEAQRDVNVQVLGRYHIRNRQLFVGSGQRAGGKAAVIKPFARVKQGRIFAEIAVGQLKGDRPLLLSRFEKGGPREPFTAGAKAAAVPILGSPVRPGINRPINPIYRFTQLKFKERISANPKPHIEGSRVRARMFQGLQRTFLISHSRGEPEGAVFQRFGPERDDVRVIYAFRSGIQLDHNLGFVDTVTNAINRTFSEFLQREALDALAHAKAKS